MRVFNPHFFFGVGWPIIDTTPFPRAIFAQATPRRNPLPEWLLANDRQYFQVGWKLFHLNAFDVEDHD